MHPVPEWNSQKEYRISTRSNSHGDRVKVIGAVQFRRLAFTQDGAVANLEFRFGMLQVNLIDADMEDLVIDLS